MREEVLGRCVTESPAFQQWTTHMSAFLSQSPEREVYLIVEPTSP